MVDGTTTRTTEASHSMPILESPWEECQGNSYRAPVYLLPEEDGGYSVEAATLPGVASQGDTEQEALDNIKVALAGAIAIHLERGKIPWLESPRDPLPDAITRWVIVHVEVPAVQERQGRRQGSREGRLYAGPHYGEPPHHGKVRASPPSFRSGSRE